MIRLPDRPVAGVDGCAGGWICVTAVSGRPLSAFVAPNIAALANRLPHRCLIAIDIPIGLPIDDSRRAESAARLFVGRRRSSIFPVPLRIALRANSREEACRLQVPVHRRGTRIGVQTWAIVPKIREVDDYLQADSTRLRRIIEVHPEVSFRLWNTAPLAASKKSIPGRATRESLIDRAWPGQRLRLAEYLRAQHQGQWAFDDLNDAFAALWTAVRIVRGLEQYFPPPTAAQVDALGIPMRIVG